MTKLQDYVDAAKLDILNLISKESPGVYEFRRASDIAGMMPALIDSYGQPTEHTQLVTTTRVSEDKAPTLHSVLLGRAFNGSALLQEKYAEMERHHRDLKIAALNIQDAAAQLTQQRSEVELHKKSLLLHEEALVRERERLQLSAATAGVSIVLPPLPELPASLRETEEEDETD
jgi:hypothetical protein